VFSAARCGCLTPPISMRGTVLPTGAAEEPERGERSCFHARRPTANPAVIADCCPSNSSTIHRRAFVCFFPFRFSSSSHSGHVRRCLNGLRREIKLMPPPVGAIRTTPALRGNAYISTYWSERINCTDYPAESGTIHITMEPGIWRCSTDPR